MKKTRSAIRIPMPLRYLINLVLILALWFVLYTLIQNGTITNYWSGILITVGINIILATSLNIATGYLPFVQKLPSFGVSPKSPPKAI